LTNATGLPIATGISGLGTGVATFLATPSSANLAAAVSDETGTGALVFANSPTLVTPALGTPASGVVTNLTGTASININGTVGATTATTGAFTDVTTSGTVTHNAGTANGVAYLNGSKVLTTGSALTFDGTNFTTPRVLFGGSTLPAAGNPSIALRSSDNVIYHQSGSANNIVMLDSAQNTMQSIGATVQTWNISNSEQMRLTSTGLGIGTSSPVSKLDVRAASAAIGNYQQIQAFSTDAAAINLGGGIALGGNYSGSSTIAVFGNIVGRKANGTDGNYDGYLAFGTNAQATGVVERARLDSSGNLGLGVTPSASAIRTVNVGSVASGIQGFSSGSFFSTANAYYASGGWTYGGTGRAFAYGMDLSSNTHQWFTSASGTAGNAISFTQAMTLDASGNLGVGETSLTERLQLYKASSNVRLKISADASNSSALQLFSSGREAAVYNFNGDLNVYNAYASGVIQFYTNATERARITSGGNFGIGTSSPSVKLEVKGGNGDQLILDNSGETYTQMGFRTNGIARGTIWATATDFSLYTYSTQPIIFYTNTTERARITSGGDLLVGTTSQLGSSNARLNVSYDGSTLPWGAAFKSDANNGIDLVFISAGNGAVGSISHTSTTTSYNTSSDYRLKNTIAPMTGALAKVALLKPCTYKWNADGSDGEGFIAHELAEVVPQCVTGEKDAVDADGKPQYQGIDTSFLVATLTAAIQEQQAIIEQLKARLDAANL
jgi:hypothetical protein